MLLNVIAPCSQAVTLLDKELRAAYPEALIRYNIVKFSCEECSLELPNLSIQDLPCERPFLRVIADLLYLVKFYQDTGDKVVVLADLTTTIGQAAASLLFALPLLLVEGVLTSVDMYIYAQGRLHKLTRRDLVNIGRAMRLELDLGYLKRILDVDQDEKIRDEFLRQGFIELRQGAATPRDVFFIVYAVTELLTQYRRVVSEY